MARIRSRRKRKRIAIDKQRIFNKSVLLQILEYCRDNPNRIYFTDSAIELLHGTKFK